MLKIENVNKTNLIKKISVTNVLAPCM